MLINEVARKAPQEGEETTVVVGVGLLGLGGLQILVLTIEQSLSRQRELLEVKVQVTVFLDLSAVVLKDGDIAFVVSSYETQTVLSIFAASTLQVIE